MVDIPNWINAFLCFRQQRVTWCEIGLDSSCVGCRQGTVLGPLLFSLYINDISVVIVSDMRLFADNCVCNTEEDNARIQKIFSGGWGGGGPNSQKGSDGKFQHGKIQ